MPEQLINAVGDSVLLVPMPKAGALFGLVPAELTQVMAGWGDKPYRVRQVWEALYKQRVGVGGGDDDAE